MKPQFSIATLLLSTAFVAITLGAWVAVNQHTVQVLPEEYLVIVPFSMPFAFCGYALGRRAVSLAFLVTFAITEAIAIAIGIWGWRTF